MLHKPLFAALFSALLAFSPLVTNANVGTVDPVSDGTPSSTQTTLAPNDFPAAASTQPSSTTSTELVAAVAEAPPSTMVCLAMVEPNPLEGPEWIALYGLTPTTTDALLGWSLLDAQGSLVKFSTSTALLWDEETLSIRVELKSSRLNNGGDTVIINNPQGLEHDRFAYTETLKGERWFRGGCAAPWYLFPERGIPTPPVETPVVTPPPAVETIAPATSAPTTTTSTSATIPTTAVDPVMTVTTADIAPLPETEPEAGTAVDVPSAVSSAAPDPAEPSTQTTILIEKPPLATTSTAVTLPAATGAPIAQASQTAIPAVTMAPTVAKKEVAAVAAKSVAAAKTAAASAKAKTTATSTKKTVAPKKAAAKTPTKKAIVLTPISMSDLFAKPDAFQGVRVRLTGRVATQKDVIAANRYVLINADGRGLIVHATTKLPSPPQGAIIEVTGTITWNDQGLWLKQSTTDQWLAQTMTDEQKNAAMPVHKPNLTAPGQEDAWSHVSIEGKVTAVQKSSFDIDLDSGVVRVRVSAKLGYRTQRLQVGDVVSLQGLLDLRGEDPVIIPQTAETIQIVKRTNLASTSAGTAKAPVSYPWLPVGAAASTLGLSEGWRRLRDRQKRRREEASFKALVQHHASAEREELE